MMARPTKACLISKKYLLRNVHEISRAWNKIANATLSSQPCRGGFIRPGRMNSPLVCPAWAKACYLKGDNRK